MIIFALFRKPWNFKKILNKTTHDFSEDCPFKKQSMEKEMATHSSILAWRIPWTEEPGGLVYGVAKCQT